MYHTGTAYFGFRLLNVEAASVLAVLLEEDRERVLPAVEATFAEVRTLFFFAISFTSFHMGVEERRRNGGGACRDLHVPALAY